MDSTLEKALGKNFQGKEGPLRGLQEKCIARGKTYIEFSVNHGLIRTLYLK